MSDRLRLRARARMLRYRSPHDLATSVRLGRHEHEPVIWADYQGGLADCRAALCIAMGVPLNRIDPSSGHNLNSEGN